MEQADVERIARAALKELGLVSPDLAVTQLAGQPGVWQIDIRGNIHGPVTLKVKCGLGSTAHWVREQIFDQYSQS